MLTLTYFWHEVIEDSRFGYAVMVTRCGTDWLFVRQAVRHTYELPGGRREPGESILQTARRELQEETGAARFELDPICAFKVDDSEQLTAPDSPCGMLYLAKVQELGALPIESEIAEVIRADQMPQPLSYPQIQPKLFALAVSWERFRIRPARQADSTAIQRLNQVCLGYDYPIDQTVKRVAMLLRSPGDGLFMAEETATGRVIGYIHLADYTCVYADRMKNILAIAVDPSSRGQAVGRRLLARAEQWACDQGAAGVRLVSVSQHTGAHCFYQACGYQLSKTQHHFVKLFA